MPGSLRASLGQSLRLIAAARIAFCIRRVPAEIGVRIGVGIAKEDEVDLARGRELETEETQPDVVEHENVADFLRIDGVRDADDLERLEGDVEDALNRDLTLGTARSRQLKAGE